MPFEVPEGWCWTTIGEVSSSILYGVSESAKKEGAYKLLRITDIQDNKVDWNSVPYTNFDKDKALSYLLQDGDILFARTGATVGKSYLVSNLTEESIYASYLIRVQTSNLILPEYIKRFFESGYYWEQITLSSVGIGQPNVNGTTLANLNIPIPPYKEQVRIVEEANRWLSIADILDDNTMNIGKAIESAKAKILDLAIHGKLVPQDPTDEPAFELLKRINPKAVASCDNPHYTEPYELPHGWKWVELGKLAVDSADGPFGSNLKKEHYTINKEVRIIQLSNIGEEGWKDENTKYTTFEHLSAISRSEVKSGDIVIAKMMPAGRAILCPNSDVKYVLSSDAVKFVIPEGICNEYILNSINSSVFREQIYGNVQGVTRVRTSLQKLRTYVLPIPPIKEQLRIVAKVKELFSQLDMIEESLQA